MEGMALRESGEMLLMVAEADRECAIEALSGLYRVGMRVGDCDAALPRLNGGGGYGPRSSWPKVLGAAQAWMREQAGIESWIQPDEVNYLGWLSANEKNLPHEVHVWQVDVPGRVSKIDTGV